MESGIVIVSTVVDDKEAADRIARELVERRLAACVQVSAEPVTSTYWWEGKVETAREWSLTCKTTASGAAACMAAIADTHPYDTPEVLAVPVVGGFGPYLEWVAAETRG